MMNFHKYIKAVGTGPKSNHDLSFEESADMMTQILNRSVHGEQIAAFLLGWRMKSESIDEFKGAIKACDSFIKKRHIEDSLELGYPFDGKAKNPYIFPLVSQILQNQNLNLVVSGDILQPAKCGITTKYICDNIKLPPNLYYFDRFDFFKNLHDLSQVRNRLGLRTGLNTIEKLSQVGNSQYAITGVFHKPYVKKYIEIFGYRYKRLALIQGNEGTPELFSKGSLWVFSKGKTEEFEINPNFYGIKYKNPIERITQEESLQQLKNPTKECRELALLNAAIYLFVSNRANSIDEAYEKIKISR